MKYEECPDKLQCTYCKKSLPIEQFKLSKSVKSKNRFGRGYSCIDCNRDRMIVNKSMRKSIEQLEDEISRDLQLVGLKNIAIKKMREKQNEKL